MAFSSLERIFIENRIYRDIEEEETWEGVISAIDKGLQPHIKHLKRAVTEKTCTIDRNPESSVFLNLISIKHSS